MHGIRIRWITRNNERPDQLWCHKLIPWEMKTVLLGKGKNCWDEAHVLHFSFSTMLGRSTQWDSGTGCRYWFQVRFAQPSQWSHWFRPDHGHTHCHLSFQRCQIFQFFSTIWLSGTSSVLLLDKEADRNIAWPHGNFIINNDDGVTRADKESSAIGEPQRTFFCRRMKQLNEHTNDELGTQSIFCCLTEAPAADATLRWMAHPTEGPEEHQLSFRSSGATADRDPPMLKTA
jgi:hypothetical protein